MICLNIYLQYYYILYIVLLLMCIINMCNGMRGNLVDMCVRCICSFLLLLTVCLLGNLHNHFRQYMSCIMAGSFGKCCWCHHPNTQLNTHNLPNQKSFLLMHHNWDTVHPVNMLDIYNHTSHTINFHYHNTHLYIGNKSLH